MHQEDATLLWEFSFEYRIDRQIRGLIIYCAMLEYQNFQQCGTSSGSSARKSC